MMAAHKHSNHPYSPSSSSYTSSNNIQDILNLPLTDNNVPNTNFNFDEFTFIYNPQLNDDIISNVDIKI